MTNAILKIVRDTIRNPYVWPGGYPRYVILSDGALLCPRCARNEYEQISYATRHQLHDGWRAEGSMVLWETDAPEHCAHCEKELNSAYGQVK